MSAAGGFFFPDTDPRLFTCPCGRECDAPKGPSPLLLGVLNRTRALYGAPMAVTSGPRCRAYNAQVGGADDSEHTVATGCEGADVACVGSRMRWGIVNAAIQAGVTRIGIGDRFIHLGVSERHDGQVIWTYDPRRT